eukprot:scaffold43737_cov204-Skeletonema_marinoi.AAC.16
MTLATDTTSTYIHQLQPIHHPSRLHHPNPKMTMRCLLLILSSIVTYTSVASAFSGSHHKRTSMSRPISANPATYLKSVSVPEAIDEFYKTMPLTSAFFTCGIKASAADIIAQQRGVIQLDEEAYNNDETQSTFTLTNPIDDIETKRNIAFLLYGGLYQGISQQIIFNNIFPRMFGQGTDVLTVMSKVSFDMLVVSPLICLPVAYVVKSFVFQHSLNEAMLNYKDDVMNNSLLFRYWCIWGPVQCITFGVVPQHLRIVFIAVVSFFWLVIFSTISNDSSK